MDDTAMSSASAGATELRSVLAFDGDCGFCQAVVRQMQLRARPRTKAVAWQALPTGIDLEVVSFGLFDSLVSWGSLSGWCRTSCGTCLSGWCRWLRIGRRAVADDGTGTVRS